MRFLPLVLLVGCTTTSAHITTLQSAAAIPKEQCEVQLFTARETVGGEITELCMVSAFSKAGLDHSLGAAIANGKEYICKCGATKAYIKESREEAFMQAGSVILVGFK